MAQKRVDFVIKEKGAAKVKKGFKGVDGAMSSAAKSAAMYAGAYIGVRGIINITKQAIEAFGIQEQAEKRLTVATGRNTDALLKQASALQQVTTFGDEMIIGVQASLAAFAESDDEIKRLTVATLDLASATGMDLKAAGDLIAKSYGSSTNALSRYGIEVTGVANSTERLDTLTGNIAARFEGQAAAAAETMAGAIAQANNAFGDLLETMGGFLAPDIIGISKWIKEVSENLNVMFQVSKKFTDQDSVNQLTQQYTNLKNGIVILEAELKKYTVSSKGYNDIQDMIVADTLKMRRVDKDREALIKLIGQALKELTVIEKDQVVVIEETTAAIEEQAGTMVNFAGIAASALGEAFDPDLGAGEAFKGFVIQFMSLLQGVILASEAVSTSLTFMFTGPVGIATAIAALATLEGAKALVRNVEFAATGADFVTNGPQLLMVGEAGREQVSVTPLEGPNINGPQGGVTVNFNGPITDREYVRGYIIPEIKEAVRLNA